MSKEVKPPNRLEIENLILASLPKCPFCSSKQMTFDWGYLVPKKMRCQVCGACWEPLMSYDGNWSFVAAKLAEVDCGRKGVSLLNRMYPREFWKNMLTQEPTPKEIPKENLKTVIIREIVKIRCPYCGGLYDEIEDRCPYCSGKR